MRRLTKLPWLVLPAPEPQRFIRLHQGQRAGMDYQIAPDLARAVGKPAHHQQLWRFIAVAGDHIGFGRQRLPLALARQIAKRGDLAVRARRRAGS